MAKKSWKLSSRDRLLRLSEIAESASSFPLKKSVLLRNWPVNADRYRPDKQDSANFQQKAVRWLNRTSIFNRKLKTRRRNLEWQCSFDEVRGKLRYQKLKFAMDKAVPPCFKPVTGDRKRQPQVGRLIMSTYKRCFAGLVLTLASANRARHPSQSAGWTHFSKCGRCHTESGILPFMFCRLLSPYGKRYCFHCSN